MASYFTEWEQIVTRVFELVKGNELLLRYLCNDDPEPEKTPAPDWLTGVFMKRVLPVPKDPDTVSTQKSFINIYVNSTYPIEGNPYYRIDYLNIDVVCNLDIWALENGRMRPYVICDLLDEMLNFKNMPELSIQKVLNIGAKVTKFGDMFYGYKVAYKLTNAGAISCE